MFFRNKARKNPEYQQLLQTGLRIKELLKKIPSEYVFIYPLGVMEFSPIQTCDSVSKSQAPYNPEILEFGAWIEDKPLERSMQRYLNYHYAAVNNSFDNGTQKDYELKRDAEGRALMQWLFGDYCEEFLSLTKYSILDIVLDCIDYRDDRHDKYLLHFRFWDAWLKKDAFKKDARKVFELLVEDIRNA